MSSAIIPIFRTIVPDDCREGAPPPASNIFTRIIRDPTAPDRPKRERQCTELLCAMLLNCETLKTRIFEQIAELCGWSSLPIEELTYEIDTEQSIQGKRDDLRIEGYLANEDDRRRVILWTVEVKVQAGFHSSTSILEEESDVPRATVSQLNNYDVWLQSQNVQHKAGIVISVSSLESEVDALSLTQPWFCLRWADLGNWVEESIKAETLPQLELMFGKHFLGFVWQYLWDPTEMTSQNIGIDDLALIRAFAVQGMNCEKRINNLVEPLVQSLNNSGIEFCSAVKHQQTLFRSYLRSTVHGSLIRDSATKPAPCMLLMAGIRRDEACVWIESSPACTWKSRFREICGERSESLKQQNPDWMVFAPDDSGWKDVLLTKPLPWLLVEDDQATALKTFVESAVNDLKSVGLITALQGVPAAMAGDSNT